MTVRLFEGCSARTRDGRVLTGAKWMPFDFAYQFDGSSEFFDCHGVELLDTIPAVVISVWDPSSPPQETDPGVPVFSP